MTAPATRRDNLNCQRPVAAEGENPAQKYIARLIETGVLNADRFERLDVRCKREMKGYSNLDRLLMRLVDFGLLTAYQAGRLQGGQKNGLILGPYRILDRLGAGASSVIFKAEHRETGQAVALKVLIPGQMDDSMLLRFDVERRAISRLDHPHIVRLLDVGEATSPDPDAPLLYYYAMEYLPGVDLENYVRQHGRLPVEQVCQVALQLADALDCAHQNGLVHRDVKPSNILWTEDGQAKLLDFGLARQSVQGHTQPGTILGALEYIAPEQAREGAQVDIRADIFALGSTLYFCLTQQAPFPLRGNLDEVLKRRATERSPSVQALNDQVSAPLDAVLARMMALDPADRYQTPGELVLSLRELINPAASASQATTETLPDSESDESRLLIVSSSKDVARMLEEAARPLGWYCEVLQDPTGMVQALENFDPQFVVLDLALAEVQSLDLIHKARQTGSRKWRKIMVAAHGTCPRPLADYLAAGADELFILPQASMALQVRLRSLQQFQEAEQRVHQLRKEPAGARPVAETAILSAGVKKTTFWGWLRRKK